MFLASNACATLNFPLHDKRDDVYALFFYADAAETSLEILGFFMLNPRNYSFSCLGYRSSSFGSYIANLKEFYWFFFF